MADAHIKGPEMAKAAAAAKLFATDTAMWVATEAVQLHGAHGISNEGGINRYMRDAKLLQVVEGVSRFCVGDQRLADASSFQDQPDPACDSRPATVWAGREEGPVKL